MGPITIRSHILPTANCNFHSVIANSIESLVQLLKITLDEGAESVKLFTYLMQNVFAVHGT